MGQTRGGEPPIRLPESPLILGAASLSTSTKLLDGCMLQDVSCLQCRTAWSCVFPTPLMSWKDRLGLLREFNANVLRQDLRSHMQDRCSACRRMPEFKDRPKLWLSLDLQGLREDKESMTAAPGIRWGKVPSLLWICLEIVGRPRRNCER